MAAEDNKDKSLDDTEQERKDNSEEEGENDEEKKPHNLDQLDQVRSACMAGTLNMVHYT